MTFPETVRVHQIVDYWFCCERSRLMACYGLEAHHMERMDEGCEVHRWLEGRPKTRRENKLHEALKPFEPYTRVFEGVKILAHPDDLVVLNRNKVQIVEYKTVDKVHVKPWKSLLHKIQVQIYAWILESILKNLGYQLAHYHTVIYLKRNGVFLRRVSVEQDNCCVEKRIKEVFDFWKTGNPVIAPMKWKCNQCQSIFQSQCRIWNPRLSSLDKKFEVSYNE